MAIHIKLERVVDAVRELSQTNNALFAEFLILKYHGMSDTEDVTITNESTRPGIDLLMAVRKADGSEVVPGHPYFNPYARSEGWRVEEYPRTGPQTNINGAAWQKVVITSDQLPRKARLRPDYLTLMAPSLLTRKSSGAKRIPFGAAAIWAARAETFDDDFDNEKLEAWFQSIFKITVEEREIFFEGEISDNPFVSGAVDIDALATILLVEFPPGHTPALNEEDQSGREEAEKQAAQELPSVLLDRIRGELVIPDVTIRQLITLIRMGKNIILTGPPGTGKTTLAERLARVAAEDAAKPPADRIFDLPACDNYLSTTATADWSTFDTIGGYVPAATGAALEFREGLFLQAIRENRWLIIDELNRSDADKAFGQLFTVLSGQEVELPFRTGPDKGNNLSIRRDGSGSVSRYEPEHGRYVIATDWRIVATMNTFDRNHLFQLSTAFVRRFAIVNVPVPTFDELSGWLESRSLEPWVLSRVEKLLRILEKERPLGPALIQDFIEYVALRLVAVPGAEEAFAAEAPFAVEIDAPLDGTLPSDFGSMPQSYTPLSIEDPFLEATIAFILPQMDGLDGAALGRLKTGLHDVVAKASYEELDRQFRDLFRV